MRAALKQAVEQYGADWVDPNSGPMADGCMNVYRHEDETRRCIAAQALHNLGVEDHYLVRTNSWTARETVSFLVREAVVVVDDANDHVVSLLIEAQVKQDKGQPWGDCINV